MSGRTVYMCLSVRGALRNMHQSRSRKSPFTETGTGRELSRQEAIVELEDELSKGHEVIPMGEKCGNPCGNAGCTGFDYGKNGGCPGYVPVDSENLEAQ